MDPRPRLNGTPGVRSPYISNDLAGGKDARHGTDLFADLRSAAQTGRLGLRGAGRARGLDPVQFVQGALVDQVAGVQRGREKDPALFVGDGAVLDAARHYEELAFFQPDVLVAKLHAEASFDYQEEFVFVLVVVPDELALQLVELNVLAIEFSGDAGLPEFVDFVELLGEVNFVHERLGSAAE